MPSIRDLVSKLLNEKGGVGGGGIPVRDVQAMRMQNTPLSDSDPMLRGFYGPSGVPAGHIVTPISKGVPWWEGSKTQALLGGQNPLDLDRTKLAKLLSEAGINTRTTNLEFSGGQLLDQFGQVNPWEAMLLRFKSEGLSPDQIPSLGRLTRPEAAKLPYLGAYNPAENRIIINETIPLPNAQRKTEGHAGVFAHEGEHALSRLKHGVTHTRPERILDEGFSNFSIRGAELNDYFKYLSHLEVNGSPTEKLFAKAEREKLIDTFGRHYIAKPIYESARDKSIRERLRVAAGPLGSKPDMIGFVESSGHMRPEINTNADLPMYYMAKEAATMGADPGVWGQYFPTALQEGKNAFQNRVKVAPWLGVFDKASPDAATAAARAQAWRNAAKATAGVGAGLGAAKLLNDMRSGEEEAPEGAMIWPMMMFGRGLEEYAPIIQKQ